MLTYAGSVGHPSTFRCNVDFKHWWCSGIPCAFQSLRLSSWLYVLSRLLGPWSFHISSTYSSTAMRRLRVLFPAAQIYSAEAKSGRSLRRTILRACIAPLSWKRQGNTYLAIIPMASSATAHLQPLPPRPWASQSCTQASPILC
jgi:hypothetical protein